MSTMTRPSWPAWCTKTLVAVVVLLAAAVAAAITVAAASAELRRRYHTSSPLDRHVVFTYTPARHRALLRILKHFDAFCAAHGIPYWICGGTALGHQRCGGIIPFDDDADVAVPREHLAFLRQNFPSGWLAVVDHHVPEFKVVDTTDTSSVERAFVDVFGVQMDPAIGAYRFTNGARSLFAKQIFYPSEVFPLRTVAFHDIRVQAMQAPQTYLARTYGASWDSELVVFPGHGVVQILVLLAALRFGRQRVALTDEVRGIMTDLARNTLCLGDAE